MIHALVVVLALVLVLAAVYIERQVHPWRRCPRCHGTGRVNRIGPASETWAVCRRCRGEKEIRRFLAPKR